jgi:sugar phosphate isomerase/epimerase
LRIGVDSYSYHRLLGEVRPGEVPARGHLPDGGLAVIAEARRLELDGVSLETCFLGAPDPAMGRVLADAAGPLELVFAWGAPNGLAFGASSTALSDLLAWLEVAAAAGTRTLRIVVAGPALRGREHVELQIERTCAPLRVAARRAAALGIGLAIENHADLTARQLGNLIERANDDAIGVCFDTANAQRVGDDVPAALRLLAPHVLMVHLKDVEPTAEDPIAGPRSVAYGTGAMPLVPLLDLLSQRGFAGLLCVEIGQLAPGADERVLVSDSVDWLRARGYAERGS